MPPVNWCAGIAGMSMRSRKGSLIFCCRVIWSEWESQLDFNLANQEIATFRVEVLGSSLTIELLKSWRKAPSERKTWFLWKGGVVNPLAFAEVACEGREADENVSLHGYMSSSKQSRSET